MNLNSNSNSNGNDNDNRALKNECGLISEAQTKQQSTTQGPLSSEMLQKWFVEEEKRWFGFEERERERKGKGEGKGREGSEGAR